ncbi:MAG TPA: carboxypeptidase-like regulatory domain-containing protein, partial [Myxococcaceae bacterium]|nr:carboxypeptidase-like regulatory domain-containing protein [Myxococcaceae bacterium]
MAVAPGARRTREVVEALSPDAGVRTAAEVGASLTVAVIDPRGQPIEPCLLGLRFPGGRPLERAARSCAAVELGPLPPGDYLLAAEGPGYRRSERPVHLEVGSNAAEVLLEEGPSLSGRVVDASGRPAAGVPLVVSPIGVVARSDGAGVFRISIPGPGVYRVEAHHAARGGAERTVNAPASDILLELRPRAVLELQVLCEGRPVEGALAVLFDRRDQGPGGQYPADRPTGPDGRVRLQGFPPGTYALGVMHPGMLSAGSQEVVLHDGETTSRTVRLTADRGTTLEGAVVDRAGHPVAGARVVARPFDGPPAETGSDGGFQLTSLREGVDYLLTAVAGSGQGTATGRAGSGAVRIELGEERLYRGRVVDEARRPVATFRVAGVDVASAAGRFSVPLRASGETVTLTVEAPGMIDERLVRPSGQEEVGDIVMRAAPLVRGVVKTADGRPASGALVTCEGCRGEEALGDGARLSTRCDAAGRFALPLLAS